MSGKSQVGTVLAKAKHCKVYDVIGGGIVTGYFGLGAVVAYQAIMASYSSIKSHNAEIKGLNQDIAAAEQTMDANKLGYSLVEAGIVSPNDPTYGPQHDALIPDLRVF